MTVTGICAVVGRVRIRSLLYLYINRLFLSLVFPLTLSGCSDNPKIIQNPQEYAGNGVNAVYVVSHDWHTGFVVPAKRVYQSIPILEQRFGDSAYLEFGWGDKKFYQAKEITTGLAIRAILWPTETVVHAVALPEKVREYFVNSQITLICLDDKALSFLVEFISSSFSRNAKGEVEMLAKGIYGDSQFYKGAGDYHLLNTCNEWTAKGLKSIGMDISPGRMLTAESVMSYLSEKDASRDNVTASVIGSVCAFN